MANNGKFNIKLNWIFVRIGKRMNGWKQERWQQQKKQKKRKKRKEIRVAKK